MRSSLLVIPARTPARLRPALHALGFALACASCVPPPPAPRPAPSAAEAPSPHAPAPSAEPGPEAPAPTEPSRPAAQGAPELRRFHAALRQLEDGQRSDHVRLLWLGDSHGQADFWSGALRKGLQDRFGVGGPGFVHLGYKNYRHDGLKLDIRGKWRMRPKRPTSTKREADGAFGLGGLMMGGYAGSPRVVLSLNQPMPGERVGYDLCYRLEDREARIQIDVPGVPRRVLTPDDARPLHAVLHERFDAPQGADLTVTTQGRTSLCGVVVEADPSAHPGVVLDTLAINGARFGTALAWDEAAWTSEVARRKPSLLILEYGTNEAGDARPPYQKVADQALALVARVRTVAPEVDCVLVSPTDRADAESRVPPMRDRLREAAATAGCHWFDAYELLGGRGAMKRLSEEPDPKVQPDGIHLTIRGYRELGETMLGDLLRGYPEPPKR